MGNFIMRYSSYAFMLNSQAIGPTEDTTWEMTGQEKTYETFLMAQGIPIIFYKFCGHCMMLDKYGPFGRGFELQNIQVYHVRSRWFIRAILKCLIGCGASLCCFYDK